MRNSISKNISAASAAADAAGATIDATSILAASAQAVVTGTSTGTLKFQASNDLPSQCTTDSSGKLQPVNWSDVGAGMQVAIAGAGAYLIPKFDCSYQWLRLFFSHTNAAAGTISANTDTKGF